MWSAGPVFVIAVPTPRPSMRSLLVAAVRTPRAADHLCTVTEAQAETGATRLWRSLCRRFHSTRLRISAVATCGIFGQSLLECRQFEVEGIPPSCHSQEPPAMQVARNGGRRPSLPEWRQRVASRQSPSFTPHPKQPARPNKRTGVLALAPVPYGLMISTTLRRSAIHAADHLPDSELGPCLAAGDHPADRAAA